jgi:beta-glucosidase
MRNRAAWTAITALLVLAACSGKSATPTPTSSATSGGSHRPSPPPVSTDASGPLCQPRHFALVPQRRADAEARQLLRQMTLPQKVAVMHGVGLHSNGVPAGGTAPLPKLHIPPIHEADGPGGVGDGITGVTRLPAPIALAATFDPVAARCYGQVIGSEARSKGIALMYSPVVNLVRVPQWGRAFESFGEDPVLSGTIAQSDIAGTQSAGVMAEAKHLAVYNQETNRNTPADNAIVSQRTLQELYLKVWRYVAAASPAAVMCAYSTVNGTPACENRQLMRDGIDRMPGFAGFVGADFNAAHSTVASARAGLDQEQPASRYFGGDLVKAVTAGDVPMRDINEAAGRILAQLYRFHLIDNPIVGAGGSVVASVADARVAALVAEESTTLLKNTHQALPLPDHGSIAVFGPAASLEPVDTGAGTAHVVSPGSIGPLRGLQTSPPKGVTVSYLPGLPAAAHLAAIPSDALKPAYPAHGTSGAYHGTLTAPQTGRYILGLTSNAAYSPVTLSLDGHVLLSDADAPPPRPFTTTVRLQRGYHYHLAVSGAAQALTWATPDLLNRQLVAATAAAKQATAAVVVVADGQESEATDRASLALPSAQDELIRAVAAGNRRTVVVVDAGGAVTMPWLHDVAAVVDQWYPGQADGAVLADVLFGKANPSGHLPLTFPKSDRVTPVSSRAQFPGQNGRVRYSEGLDIGYRWWLDRHRKPLFPFGYGLSYTSFRYGAPSVTVSTRGGAPTVTVKETVTNTGKRDGADVAQAYFGSPAPGEPTRQLGAYQRVNLAAGQSRTVTLTIPATALAAYVSGKLRVAAGTYRLWVGDSSATAQLQGPVNFRIPKTSVL